VIEVDNSDDDVHELPSELGRRSSVTRRVEQITRDGQEKRQRCDAGDGNSNDSDDDDSDDDDDVEYHHSNPLVMDFEATDMNFEEELPPMRHLQPYKLPDDKALLGIQ
jgi:hypothetical protein